MSALVDDVRAQLRAAMARDGCSAAELARRLGCGVTYVYQLLDGQRSNLTLAQLERVARALDREARVTLPRRRCPVPSARAGSA